MEYVLQYGINNYVSLNSEFANELSGPFTQIWSHSYYKRTGLTVFSSWSNHLYSVQVTMIYRSMHIAS